MAENDQRLKSLWNFLVVMGVVLFLVIGALCLCLSQLNTDVNNLKTELAVIRGNKANTTTPAPNTDTTVLEAQLAALTTHVKTLEEKSALKTTMVSVVSVTADLTARVEVLEAQLAAKAAERKTHEEALAPAPNPTPPPSDYYGDDKEEQPAVTPPPVVSPPSVSPPASDYYGPQ